MRIAFPDLHWTIEEQIAEADKVLTRFTWAGIHKAEFLGVLATRHQVSVLGMVIDRLENGKIKETRILMDALGLMQQLGVLPPPGGFLSDARSYKGMHREHEQRVSY
jgi:predicted ester cyclase